jgi:PKD repeat protein
VPRRLALAALAVVALAALPSLSLAATPTRDRPGDVKHAKGLTTPEKLALDIFRVDVIRGGDLLAVDVRVRGNIAERLGRGHLRRALVELLLTSADGNRVGIGLAGSGRRERTLVLSKRVRGAAPLPDVAVTRHRQVVSFFISGYDLDSLRKIRGATVAGAPARTTSARAARDIYFSWQAFADWADAPKPVEAVEDCRELRDLIAHAEVALSNVPKPYSMERYRLGVWLQHARDRLAVLCPKQGGPSVGNPVPGNTPPTATFSFSPANNPPTAPRAGSPVSFTGTASDPDGTVVSWKWEFGDGTSESGTGAAPSASHSYGTAGGYNARLIVTDDRGTSYTTATQKVKVSGPGTKTADTFDVDCTQAGITIDIYIPSWAQAPYTPTVNDPICPGRSQTVTGEIVPGTPPPPHDALDEHDQPKKIYRITVMFGGTGSSPTGSATASVSWN